MAKQTKKKSKVGAIMKWVRRISFVAGVIGAVRKWQMDQNQGNSQDPPRP